MRLKGNSQKQTRSHIKLTSRVPQASSWIYWEGRKGGRNGKGIEKGEKAERERKGEDDKEEKKGAGRERKGDRPHGDFQ